RRPGRRCRRPAGPPGLGHRRRRRAGPPRDRGRRGGGRAVLLRRARAGAVRARPGGPGSDGGTRVSTVTLATRGPFSLAQTRAFLEGWPPADARLAGGALRVA